MPYLKGSTLMSEPMLQIIQPLIVSLRRQNNVEENWPRFREIIERDTEEVCRRLNTRWLVAVCDTYIDLGDELERRNAMFITMLANMEKVGQSYVNWRVNYTAPFEVPQEYEPRKIQLWDGMTSMHLAIGDVTNNLFRRLEILLSPTPHLHKIYHAVLQRIAENDTILGTMNRFHKHVFEPSITWRDGPEYDEWRRQGKIP
jgi:hypothetical protein